MTIYRYLPSYYVAKAVIKGRFFHAYGKTHFEAIALCLKGIKREGYIK